MIFKLFSFSFTVRFIVSLSWVITYTYVLLFKLVEVFYCTRLRFVILNVLSIYLIVVMLFIFHTLSLENQILYVCHERICLK